MKQEQQEQQHYGYQLGQCVLAGVSQVCATCRQNLCYQLTSWYQTSH